MAKRKRTSRKPKKRTSRRNAGGWGASPLGRRPRRNTGVSAARVQSFADETVKLVTRWKHEYMERYGVNSASLIKAGDEAVARMHTLLDEGLSLKKAYEETNDLFQKDVEPVASFADDIAYRFYTLVRDHGLSTEQAVIATSRGLGTMATNKRRRSRRR